jgi:outer membrane protein assembly factor BamB
MVMVVIAGSLLAYMYVNGNSFTTTESSRSSSSSTTTISSDSITSTMPRFTTSPSSSTPSDLYANSWLTYHETNWRDGYLATDGVSAFTSAHLSWKSVTLDGVIYAEPLIANHTILVATEGDSIYALNETSGGIFWKTNLGSPVSAASVGANPSCWAIDPIGITSTPVIDPSTVALYTVGFVSPGKFILFALKIQNGAELWNRTIQPVDMNPVDQLQRPALALANGYVYIAFGGNGETCDQYHAYLVAVPTNNTGSMYTYEVPTTNGGSIWSPSGPAIDNATGDILISTGNSNSTRDSNYDYGESVIKLSPTLQVLDYFAPTNWAQLNYEDLDLGSVGPTILNSNTVFQTGKQGVGYLLQMDHLGGIGGEEYLGSVCTSGAYGGVAYAAPYLYVPCVQDGIIALNVTLGASASFSRVWSTMPFFAGAPIVADGAVWTVDIVDLGQNGILYALNPLNGNVLFNATIGSVGHFVSPTADGNLIVTAGNDSIKGFSVS